MRKLHCLAFVMLGAVLAMVASTSAAQPPASAPAAGAADLDISVDPRIELTLVVQYLTGDYERRTNLITNFDFEYKRNIEERFRPFADHPAIATFAALARQGFSFDACPQAALHLTADGELKIRAPLPDQLLERAGGAEAFEQFRTQLADFAKASRFFEFFAQHEDFYSELTMIVRMGMRPAALVDALNEYTGMHVRHAHLVLFPLGHPGGFAAQINIPAKDDQPERMEVYALIGPEGAIDDRPTWSTVPWAESLIVHEFAHTIVNPVTAKHAERVAKSADRLEPLKAQMSRQAYQSWETVVNEHIVRALEVRIAGLRHGEEAAERKQAEELRRGFVFVPDLVAALERYEQDRPRWPTLEDFWPELLTVFERE